MGGGEMISDVTFEKTTYADLPHKFEAGTPNISGAIAFGYALDYLNEIGLENIYNYENGCTGKGDDQSGYESKNPGIYIYI